MRWLQILVRVTAIALTALCFAVLAFLGIGPRLFGYRTLTVLTGSMRPGMPAGSVAVVEQEPTSALRVGDVVVYQAPIADHRIVSHRVVSIEASGAASYVIQTKGDANNGPDPWTAKISSPTVWRVRAVVPRLGTAIRFLRMRQLHLALLYGVPLVLALIWMGEIWRPARVPLGAADA
jgi:signal peptidase